MNPHAQTIIDAVNLLLHDKSISRPDLINALEEASEDIASVLDGLRDDQRRDGEQACDP